MLAARLGEAGTTLRKMALGQNMRTLALCEPAAQFEEAMELECAVETVESLSFILNRMLEQLCARLKSRALAAQELRLRFQLEKRLSEEESLSVEELSGDEDVFRNALFLRTLRLPVAMRDATIFLKLLQLDLAANPPGAAVVKVWIRAEPAPPRSLQRGLFLPVTPEAEKLELTLARIKAVVGEGRVGVARLVDSHRPGSFRLDRFVIPAHDHKVSNNTKSEVNERPLLAMRIFRPAIRLRVRLAEGCPTSLTTDTKAPVHADLHGKVLWSAGPWRSSGEWWAERTMCGSPGEEQSGPWDREEWEIALLHVSKDGTRGNNNIGLYRIHHDLATNHWFADASYD
jgi:protein ImuB